MALVFNPRKHFYDPLGFLFCLTLISALICAASVARADSDAQAPIWVHGPICVWHEDPLTTCALVWIEHPKPQRQTWFAAKAGFGYSDGDDETVLDMQNKDRTVCIRRAFTLEDISRVKRLELSVLYDDGFVAFLNGHEVVRANVTGDVNAGKAADLKAENHEAKNFETFMIEDPKQWLRSGKNVLAIVGLNTKLASTDFSLHPALKGTTDEKEVKLIKRGATWQLWVGEIPEGDWMRSYPELPHQRLVVEAREDWEMEMRYRRKGDKNWKSETIQRHPMPQTPSTIARTSLRGLKPATEYQIELMGTLAGEPVLRRVLSMRTAPKEGPDKVNFVNGGDMFHNRKLLDAMNRRAGKLDPMFALLGGDLAYANARDAGRWYQWFDSWYENAVTDDRRQIPMIAVIGNHETRGLSRDQAKFYYSLFPLPQGRSNFVVDFGDYMSIVNLDSEHSQPVSNQTQWLDSTLKNRSQRPLLFACYHRPTYGTLVKQDNPAVRTEWVPLFEKYKVDTVFEHDHHVFKRSLPIYQGQVDQRRGVLYLGDGAWGVRLRKIPEEYGDKLPYIERADSRNHLIHVLVEGAEVHYHAIEADGNVFDRYVRQY